MVNSTSKGLMAFWSSFDEPHLMRYLEWHNCEHMAERVSIPGFQNGRRYRVEGVDGRFLMFYETRDSAVLGSDAYLHALNNPTPWTKEALTYFRDPVRNIYELIGLSGETKAFTAPYLMALRFNLEEGREADFLPLYSGPWLEALCEHKHVTRARLYQVDEIISKIMTSERKIYGGGPGAQRYLAFVEVTRPFDEAGDPIIEVTEKSFLDGHGRCDEFTDRTWLDFSLDKTSLVINRFADLENKAY